MNTKNTFLLFKDLLEPVDSLSNEDAGMFIKAVLHYQNGGDIPELSQAANVTFVFTKQQLDRSDEYYELICERNRINGAKGGRPKKPKEPTGLSGLSEKPNITQTNPDEPRITLPHPSPHPRPHPEKKEKKDNRHKYGDKVKMTEEQYQSHIEQHGKDAVDKKIDDMNDYCVMNGKSYTDYNRALQNWFRKDDEQAKAKIEAEIEQWVNPK